ncbi:MAG: YitT family protein [Defluviitaleaceae bacterium]|nr:YitT family protein [Defluviitaleaceae bacterium]
MKKFREYLEITLAAIIFAVGLQIFYVHHGIVTGGVSGLSIIFLNLSEAHLPFTIPLWVTNISLNLPILFMGFRIIGRDVFMKSVYAIGAVTVALSFAQHIPSIYPDLTLSAVFGGVMVGLSVAMMLRQGATSGGSTLLAAIIHRYLKHVKLTSILFTMDFVVIMSGMLMFGAINTMYAVVSIFITVKVTDVVISGVQSAKAAFILSAKSEEISKVLLTNISRGITSIPAKGVYTGQSRDMLLCIMSQKELVKAKEIVKEVDPQAFIIVTSATEVLGAGFSPLNNEGTIV